MSHGPLLDTILMSMEPSSAFVSELPPFTNRIASRNLHLAIETKAFTTTIQANRNLPADLRLPPGGATVKTNPVVVASRHIQFWWQCLWIH